MKTYDNSGRLVSEISVINRPEGIVVVSTTYNNDRVVSQTISTRDGTGKAQQQTFLNGRLLP